MIAIGESLVRTPNGRAVTFTCRDGTNDAGITAALNGVGDHLADEYRMKGRVLDGWALDIGGHIGGMAIPLALDHPELRVIAVEAVPENAALLTENAARNGVAERVMVLNALAAAPGTASGVCHYGYRSTPALASDGYISAHRFVGETWGPGEGDPEFAPEIAAVSLDSLLEQFGIGEVAFVKIDCEGCEWTFLDTPAVARVQTIVGEYHGGPTRAVYPRERLVEMLPGHDVTFWDEQPVNGLFEAERR